MGRALSPTDLRFLCLLPSHSPSTTMPDQALPHTSSLDDIYTPNSLLAQGERWDTLAQAFKSEFKTPAQFVARAPGRVNIIGEHIDYAGFSVLPAAIERDVLIAFATSQDPEVTSSYPAPSMPGRTVIVLRNLDSKYTPTEFEVDLRSSGSELFMPEDHHWSSYFIAGTKGVLDHLFKHPSSNRLSAPPRHLLIVVGGTVPEGSGLSSSSAMTTASALAILQVYGRRDGLGKVGRRALTEVAIESERLVGVNSGGMDQSASVFSEPLHLLHIEFVPVLKAKAIPLPTTNPAFSFVIANTLVTSNKQLTAKYCYNLRVAECQLGAMLLSKHLNLYPDSKTYKDVTTTYFSNPPTPPGPHPAGSRLPSHSNMPGTLGLPTIPALPSSPLPPVVDKNIYELKTMLGLAGTALGGPGMEDGLTWEEVAERLERDVEELKEEVCGQNEVEPVGGKLKIWTRARHVFSEALRVYEFVELLQSSSDDSILVETDLLGSLGDLMNASFASCQTDFECSCPELDDLVGLARENGAVGSRLTGAGWGGATVSLVPEPDVPKFIEAIKKGYYEKNFPQLTKEQLDDAVFATKPEAGAGVYEFGGEDDQEQN